MIVACYCRVSTEKDQQLDSLDNQIEYFKDICKNRNYELYKIYPDEGISGKQLSKRPEFLKMMRDARARKFGAILVKDVSRFARNTVDFLLSIRELKAMDINVFFVSYGMDIINADENYLTMMASNAQAESANLSVRVKWGKRQNALRGNIAVPNFVFGYDRIDKHTLEPNAEETATVRDIYDMYVNQNMGTTRIAGELNARGIKTKKLHTKWTATTVGQIIKNPIYIGRTVYLKQQVKDFLTGTREDLPKEEQIVVERPECKIIDNETYEKAQIIMEQRNIQFNMHNKRNSYQYPLSQLLNCPECGYSFRRMKRKYSHSGRTYEYWTCSSRNSYGADYCSNKTRVDEADMHEALIQYLQGLLVSKKKNISLIVDEIESKLEKENPEKNPEEIEREIAKVEKDKLKYMEMYKAEVIDMLELKKCTDPLNRQLRALRLKQQTVFRRDITSDIRREVESVFERIEQVVTAEKLENEMLKSIIEKIVVNHDGRLQLYLYMEGVESKEKAG
ncbi:MAG TPA: recombinase family protein, partial [Clostridiales bacterium]|nr:recombinase family protein [Clostridiales bacterium]